MSLLDIVQKHGGRLTLDGVEFTGRKKGRAPAPNLTELVFPSLESYSAGITEAITEGGRPDGAALKPENRTNISGIGSPERKTFAGGLLGDLIPANLPFYAGTDAVETARARITAGVSFQEFEASLANLGMKRRRFFSEHDGEYLEDRALEIAPFLATRRQSAPVRVVNLTACFSVSFTIDAAQVQEYGATIAALVSILEGAGILVGLTVETACRGYAECQRTGEGILRVTAPVKRPDEYLPPASIAAALSSNCYRRLGLAASPIVADIVGRRGSDGCGTVIREHISWDADTGTLRIPSSNFFNSPTGETDRIIQALKSALGLAPIAGAA